MATYTVTGMGCVRHLMADDPKRGVTDRNGRVHGVANLFVAGGSLFPTAGYAHPTLTIVALALRTADHLQRLSKRPASPPGRPSGP